MTTPYDKIGINYADVRKPDPRIAAVIATALGSAQTVLNVGAGTGSYEPTDKLVTAIEPSSEMINQRRVPVERVVQGYAEDLPFDDDSFDASMAILTIHHWTDQAKGIAEMQRVTCGPVVILTFDPWEGGGWLADYIPEFVKLDEAQMPKMADFARWLGPVDVAPVMVPHDCTDGFLGAYWRRPAAYLDPKVQAGSSCFWAIDNVASAMKKLADDLDSGRWAERYSNLLGQEEYDFGYRLVTTKN